MNKHALKSRTVWGGLIAAIPTIGLQIAKAAGADIPPGVEPMVTQIGAAFGGLLAVYGRGKADTPVRWRR